MTKQDAINQVSSQLGIDPSWLINLIQFESNWNPQATNSISGARGLIQFTNTTAKSMGYANANDLVTKYPDEVSQLLNPVYAYLSKMVPYPTAQSLYMAVFYPAARSWSPNTAFNDSIQAVNPGIVTVQDYINKVNKNAIVAKVKSVAPVAGLVVLLAIGGFFLYKYLNKGADESWTKKNPQIMIEN